MAYPWLIRFVLFGVSCRSLLAVQEVPSMDRTLFEQEIELAHLLDLCSIHLGLNLEYDPRIVEGRVSLRLGEGYDDDQLWALTNRFLAARGLTTVQMPGDGTLSVVKLEKAPSLARVEPDATSLEHANAGYVKLFRKLQHLTAEDIEPALESIQAVLSKPGGTVAPVTRGSGELWLLLSDLKSHVAQALSLLEEIDRSSKVAVVEELTLEHQSSTSLVALIERVVSARTSVEGRALLGKLLAAEDERRVIVVAPESVIPEWRALIARFDTRDQQQTVAYSPRFYGVEEVASVMQQTLEAQMPVGSANWKLVKDELSETLLVTGTSGAHALVGQLFERLETAGQSRRRVLRSYQLKNRSVSDIVPLVVELTNSGALHVGLNEEPPPTALEHSPADPLNGEETLSPIPGASATQRLPTKEASESELPFSLSADEGTNTLLAVGDPVTLDKLEHLIETLDVRQPQVLVEAMVFTLNQSDALDLGVELQRLGISDEKVVSLSTLFGLGSTDLQDLAAIPAGGAGLTGVLLDQGSFSALLRALRSLNDGEALTVPKVLVNNNEQAQLDSVLQSPFTSTNASDTVATTSFGGTQDAGTLISVTPQIAEGDHIVLDYSITLSSFVGDSSDPVLPPPRQQNRLKSVATIPDGFAVVVGGLEIESSLSASSAVPILGRIPLLGRLFRNDSTTQTRSKLYVFLRADVLRQERFHQLQHLTQTTQEALGMDKGLPPLEPRWVE